MMSAVKPFFIPVLVLLAACQPAASTQEKPPQTVQSGLVMPEENYGALFVDVQLGKIFPDGKTFVDCIPKRPVAEIVALYREAKGQSGFDLRRFVEAHFEVPALISSNFKADTSRSPADHINALWPVLTRNPDQRKANSTLIPLPHPYVVPGGRFGEVYYWDSYFTQLGLEVGGRHDLVQHMVANFAHLIDTLGFIPNGNRSYYLTRSQPPFFAAMVNLLAERDGAAALVRYLPQLEKEYRFWMKGQEGVSAQQPALLHVVRLPNGAILNRYYDRGDTPRAEMYGSDLATAQQSGRTPARVYMDLRAACESGWDFSSRWLEDPQRLETIHTLDIIPVDLNALLFHLEETIAAAYRAKGQTQAAQRYSTLAAQRKEALLAYCWDEQRQFFADYDYVQGQKTPVLSLAGMYPLYFGLATPAQGQAAAAVVRRLFLQPGGLQTTALTTGQQWDAPNGWAPLQWLSIQGLRRYGHHQLANTIKERWVGLNVKVYKATGKMVEKYNVVDLSLLAGGGEYPVQDGFGWTNGVLLKLLRDQPAQR